jgi:hypothetical protein
MKAKTVALALSATFAGAVGLAVLVQLIPYGRAHANPAVVLEPAWDRPETRELAVRACYDCHSNETKWPTYSHVAPLSWVVTHHVDEGRAILNFSQMDQTYEEAHEAGEVVREGEMPPRYYTLLHPEARLTPDEQASLTSGLAATLGGETEGESSDGH